MLVVRNNWLSGYPHILGYFHFLFWGCGMQGSLYPSKNEEIDKSRIRNMRSLLHWGRGYGTCLRSTELAAMTTTWSILAG